MDDREFDALFTADRFFAHRHRATLQATTPDAKGFPASAMAKRMAGDHRDPERIRAWAKTIASQLG
ncbi:hypothetical protein J5X84_44850 [Streptosporangiaceae bacterium NEAU-GS5]|nr:hypothetical protein [Streptosporangiaceae bacterium NEAU-GS5]